MRGIKVFSAVILLFILIACGSEDRTGTVETQNPAPPGILTSQQQQALDAANSVEQLLQDAASDREAELKRRLD